MGCKVDLTGKRFGRLTVIRETDIRKNGSVVWECRCDCGNIVFAKQNHLARGAVVSCGCYNKDVITIHGMTNSKLFNVWSSMKLRCFCETHPQYKDYGGRGITVCDEWLEFDNFHKWAIENGYKEGKRGKYTIDRIDVNGNYEPSNCRWADMKVQARNRRNNVVVEYNGEKHCLAEWADIMGIPYTTIASRWRRHWSTRDMLFGRP